MSKKKDTASQNGFNEILLYTTPNGNIKVEIYLQNETVWLSQQKIADLFGVDRTVVTKHIGKIFKEGELKEEVVCANFAHTTQHGAIEGKTQQSVSKFYNLDMIISVGYRVNSSQATAFRIWATERLKEYIIKGFTMDDERLKNPNNIFGKDYFDEQLARIRDIRSSDEGFIRKLPTSIRNAVPITAKTMTLQKSFSLPFKTNYIGQSQDKLQLKLFTLEPTAPKKIWV